MSILKQVIRYDNGPWLEAAWVEREVLPDYEVPATPALFGADGVELQAAVEAYVVSGEIAETVVRCHAYHATQMDELRADLGADAAQYEGLIQQCIADYVPPPAPDPVVVAMQTIIALETAAHVSSQRLYREAVLGMMEQQAKLMNMTPEQLAAKNKGYRELKAFNQQIEALREQL